jgi:hypothetical protein
MRRALIAVTTVFVLALGAGAAHAGTYMTRHGGVKATLHWRASDDGFTYTATNLTIVRRGELEFSGKPRPRLRTCRSFGCGPVVGFGTPLTVRDLDANGEPEVVFDAYSGGAHCCFVAQAWRRSGGRWRPKSHDFGNAGYRLRDVGRDGRAEWITGDDRFAYAFTSFAASRLPLQILRFRAGGFVGRTRSFPALIRRDARHWWHTYRHLRRYRGEWKYGRIAAWAGDLYNLGQRRRAHRVLRREAARGHLDGYAWHGRRFVHKLERFLRRRGY